MKHHFQNVFLQKVYTFWHCVINDEVPSTSSEIVEQIKIIQGIVLPGISKMKYSAADKKPKGKTQFSLKKTLIKGKWF